ncbi:hypothetical protein FB451DRAFT_1025451 [Mycena latifolia]|nr:hypothetical protein FB451DRAFT_1025451 [Mycena latifolia]
MRSSTLQILCCFTNIRSLRIGVPLAFELDDATVLDIARAWPRLEDLELNSFCPLIKSQVTIQGLCAFAQHCPRLAILRISFDASAVPNLEINARTFVPQHSLHTLYPSSSPITAPLPVAKFLSTIFPNLRSIKDDLTNASTEANLAYRRRWMKVKSIILRQARKITIRTHHRARAFFAYVVVALITLIQFPQMRRRSFSWPCL